MFLALILGGGAFALIAWLIFNFSVYALPFFVGITAAKLAHDSGAGLVGAGVIGLVAGGLSFGIGQFAFGAAKSVTGRIAVIAVFVAPAAIAGYFSTYGIAQLCTPAEGWRQVFSVIGGGIIAAVAFGRLTALAPLRTGTAGTPSRSACPPRPRKRIQATSIVDLAWRPRSSDAAMARSASRVSIWIVRRLGPS